MYHTRLKTVWNQLIPQKNAVKPSCCGSEILTSDRANLGSAGKFNFWRLKHSLHNANDSKQQKAALASKKSEHGQLRTPLVRSKRLVEMVSMVLLAFMMRMKSLMLLAKKSFLIPTSSEPGTARIFRPKC